jgi:RNA polymerase sigma factor (sigma-70 family)
LETLTTNVEEKRQLGGWNRLRTGSTSWGHDNGPPSEGGMDLSELAVNPAVRYVRRTALRSGGGGMTDGRLLSLFVHERDEAAFETLVRRYGPMVIGICRRVLRDGPDADDAFQATFLVLARKAATIRDRARLANWLYGVAARTAQKARTLAARRQRREVPMADLPDQAAATPTAGWDDWLPVLDRELACLPQKYRMPVVLCDLQGLTQKAAAKQLGWPEGTVSSRLSRARAMLAARLTRSGPRVSAALLAATLAETGANQVRAALVGATVRSAVAVTGGSVAAGVIISAQVSALTEGVLKAMLLSKLKIAIGVPLAVVLAASILGLGADALGGGRPGAVGAPVSGTVVEGGARWEYKAMSREEVEEAAPKNVKERMLAGLNALGDRGWELAAIDPFFNGAGQPQFGGGVGGFGGGGFGRGGPGGAVPGVPGGGGNVGPPAGPVPGNGAIGGPGNQMAGVIVGTPRGRYLFKRPK